MIDLETFKEKYNYSAKTPMMQQYLDIKFEHQDALLLFRMGDFYELFMEDALLASNVLGIALAKRSNDDAMCGVPYHALDNYLSKLIENGYKVAICEQMESPEEAKKRGYKAIVKRDVVRVITQGTILEESILNTSNPNYLISIVCDLNDKQNNSHNPVNVAYLDISTSEFGVISTVMHDLAQEIVRLMPKEILISDETRDYIKLYDILRPYNNIIMYQAASCFAYGKCKNSIESFYNIKTVDSLGDLSNSQIAAIGVILEYVKLTQKNNLPCLPFPRLVDYSSLMKIDSSTRRNLELVVNVHGKNKNTLLSTIDRTVTKQGARELYRYITSPLAEINKIQQRLDLTSFFYNNISITERIRPLLRNICDIERVIARISMNRSTPRDLLNIKNTILQAKNIFSVFMHNDVSLPNNLQNLVSSLSGHDELIKLIEDAINPDALDNIENGDFINNSYHPKLDDLRKLLNNNAEIITELKNEYIKQTGIETLKILHNNVIGLFIEVTPKYANKITHEDFIHKQTLTTALRFTTAKLQSIESEMMNAKTLAFNLEKELFSLVCSQTTTHTNSLRKMAHALAVIDVFCSFAILALDESYVRAEITDDCAFEIINGRHPVVEKCTSVFISNDCNLSEEQRLWLITGPNMAGKSTFLRQNAIITILAQIGSFVPARYAKIGVVDKLFSRIGAADDLSSGQSTFMMEMVETSAILAQSSDRSLVILDEIGRGTSTHDGVSIALSCLEYIHNHLQCRGLFATHYHELTSLSQHLQSLKKYTVAIEEKDNKILFLHKIIAGIANRSYGIHVAEMAGLPKIVIDRAKEILETLKI